MKNSTLILSLLLLLQAGLPGSLHASKRSNKPWFGGQKTAVKKEVRLTRAPKHMKVARVRRTTYAATSSRDNVTGHKIVQQAKMYQGTRYRFGGTTKEKGFDCSGLVARVWADLQLKKVPRASSALYQSGKPVHLAELQEGDLVFFKNTYKSGISHVGVYAGKNKFIHAPSQRKRVSITRLSDPYYQLHYAGARRLY